MKDKTLSSNYSFKGTIWLFMLVLSSFMYVANAQQRNVQGMVTDPNGEPIIGASVVVKGTTNGTITDFDGKFTLSNVPEKGIITITYIGYKGQDIPVAGKSTLKVTLAEDTETLDEVVVVGYGTQKKSDVTGSMVSVGAKELKSRPTANVFEAMQGKAAGVDIRTSDRPGEVGDIFIRGSRSLSASSQPLYVVDGVPLNGTVGKTHEENLDNVSPRGGTLESLNPSDIESVEVLKDASATAIYGSRGANGVILITTKRGKEGKFTFSYAGSVSTDNIKDRTTWMSAGDYLTWRRWAYYYSDPNKYPRGDEPTIENDKQIFNAASDPYAWANIERGWSGNTWDGSKVQTTDWADYVTQTGITTEHTISGSGGSEKNHSYVSFGWLKNEGTIKGQDYTRYTAKINNDMKLTEWLTLAASINATYSVQNYGMSNDGGTTSGPRSAYAAAMRNLPYAVAYDDEGKRIEYPGADSKIKTVIDEWNYSTDERKVFRALGSFYAQLNFGKIWKPLEGLSYKLNFGPDFRYYRRGMFNSAESTNREGLNYASLTKSTDFSWTLDNLIYYNRTIGKHDFGFTFLQTATKYEYEANNMSGEGIPLESSLWNAFKSLSSLKSWESSLTEKQLLSYMARMNYTYKGRYMLTASVRRDGASQLADGHKWATFPSVALGWRIDQEEFLKEISWISQLKLRLGYGVTGNNDFDASYMANTLSRDQYWMLPSGSWAFVYGPSSNVNPYLGWEEKKEWNIGVDYSFFGNRMYGKFDYYRRKIDGMIYEVNVPQPPYPNGKQWQNIGEMESKGWEFEVGGDIIQNKDFTWTSSLNMSHNSGKILTMYGNNSRMDGNAMDEPGWPGDASRIEEGAEIGAFHMWKFAGFDDKGDFLLYNKDGEVIPASQKSVDDKQYIGNYLPKVMMGWNNTFTYKNFDLGINMRSWIGFDVLNTYPMYLGIQGQSGAGQWNLWKPALDDPKYKDIRGVKQLCDYFLEDGSFLKIDAITLGYTLALSKYTKWAERLRVYGTVGNVATITGYSGHNPEVNMTGWEGGVDKVWNCDPIVRTYTLGIQVTF